MVLSHFSNRPLHYFRQHSDIKNKYVQTVTFNTETITLDSTDVFFMPSNAQMAIKFILEKLGTASSHILSNTIRKHSLLTHLVTHFYIHPITSLMIIVLQTKVAWTAPQGERIDSQWIVKLNTIAPLGLKRRVLMVALVGGQ